MRDGRVDADDEIKRGKGCGRVGEIMQARREIDNPIRQVVLPYLRGGGAELQAEPVDAGRIKQRQKIAQRRAAARVFFEILIASPYKTDGFASL